MKLEVLEQEFSVCKLDARAAADTGAPFAFLATTDNEKSLVCPTARVPDGTLAREDGWRSFRVAGPLDFSLVGILARISGAENRGIPWNSGVFRPDKNFAKKRLTSVPIPV